MRNSMSKESTYRVLPEKPKIEYWRLSDQERKKIYGEANIAMAIFGGMIGFALTFVIFGVVGIAIQTSFLTFIVVCFFGCAAAFLLTFLVLHVESSNRVIKEIERRSENAKKTGLYVVNEEASSLTLRLNRNLEEIEKYFRDLPHHLNQASFFIKNAEYEYNSNAYSLFWDAVENATQHLAQFSYKANEISSNAEFYYNKLQGHNHNFPVLPVQIKDIPNASEVVAEFNRIVRLGHTNYRFVSIWEHHRTRGVLIAGFQNLGDAMNNLGFTIENSMNQLQDSISSGFGKLDNRILEQNRMLDNIQHHREPEVTDRPTKY